MMAKKKLLITRYGKGILTGLLLDGKFVEISYEPDREASLLDAIYVGRVSNPFNARSSIWVLMPASWISGSDRIAFFRWKTILRLYL